MQPLATEQEAAEAVGDGQRITVEPIAGLEMTLEVGAPQVIGGEDLAGGLARMANGASIALLRDHAVAAENVAHGAAPRQPPARVALLEHREQLLGAPTGMVLAQLEDRLHDVWCGVPGVILGAARTLFETFGPLVEVTIDKLVAGLTRNAVELTELRH